MTSGTTNVFEGWASLSLRQIAAFVAIAETGSIVRAAERLGYTQPAVSHQLATLERVLSVRLFDRGGGRGAATLTAAGETFAAHVRTLEGGLSAARADLRVAAGGDTSTVRVGAFQSVAAGVVPSLVRRLAVTASSVRVDLVARTEERDLLEELRSGALDYAFVLLPLDAPDLEVTELLEDPFVLVSPENGAFPRRLRSLSEMRGVPLIAPRTCRSWTEVEAQLRQAGVDPTYAFRTDDALAVTAHVRSGAGVAFVGRLGLEGTGDGVSVFPVNDLIAARRIGLAWSRTRTRLPFHEQLVASASDACVAPPA